MRPLFVAVLVDFFLWMHVLGDLCIWVFDVEWHLGQLVVVIVLASCPC